MSFPSKEKRTACWAARDKYWQCLDEHKFPQESEKSCEKFRKMFESGCPAQWVKHFDRKRSYLKFKERIENDGYEPVDKYQISSPPIQISHALSSQKHRVYRELV